MPWRLCKPKTPPAFRLLGPAPLPPHPLGGRSAPPSPKLDRRSRLSGGVPTPLRRPEPAGGGDDARKIWRGALAVCGEDGAGGAEVAEIARKEGDDQIVAPALPSPQFSTSRPAPVSPSPTPPVASIRPTGRRPPGRRPSAESRSRRPSRRAGCRRPRGWCMAPGP